MKSKAKVCRHTNDVHDTLIVELNGARLGVVVDRRTFKEESRDIVFQLDTYAALHNITPDEQAESEVSPPPDTPEPGPVRTRLEVPRRGRYTSADAARLYSKTVRVVKRLGFPRASRQANECGAVEAGEAGSGE